MRSLRFHVMLMSPAALHELPALPVRHLHLQIRPDAVDVSELLLSHSSVSTALPRVPSDPLLVSRRYITRAFNFYIFPKPFSRTSPDIKFICQVRDPSCAATHPSPRARLTLPPLPLELQHRLPGQPGLRLQQGLPQRYVCALPVM